MLDWNDLARIVAVAGDGATLALVLILWRFDRRILRIELTIEQVLKRLHWLNGRGDE